MYRTVLYAYFDDSHTHEGTRTVTMAGYIAQAEGWEKFEKQSRALFKRDRVKLFHAKDFDRRTGNFKDIKAETQLRFAAEWLDIAKDTVMCGYAVAIDKTDYLAAKLETGLAQSISAYGYCFKILLSRMCRNRAMWERICAENIHLIVEDGNVRNDGLRDDFQRMLKENGPLNGRVLSLRFARKTSCAAIQLADYLASMRAATPRDTAIAPNAEFGRSNQFCDGFYENPER
jgi:hypothetical protein